MNIFYLDHLFFFWSLTSIAWSFSVFYCIVFQSLFNGVIQKTWNDIFIFLQLYAFCLEAMHSAKSNANTAKKAGLCSFISSLLFPLLLTCINSCYSQQWGLWIYQHFGLLRFIFVLISSLHSSTPTVVMGHGTRNQSFKKPSASPSQ